MQTNCSIKNSQKASDQPDSNQWPRDNCYASTVSRSANWAIVGWEHPKWEISTFRFQFSPPFWGINRWFLVHSGGPLRSNDLCFRSIHVFRDQQFFWSLLQKIVSPNGVCQNGQIGFISFPVTFVVIQGKWPISRIMNVLSRGDRFSDSELPRHWLSDILPCDQPRQQPNRDFDSVRFYNNKIFEIISKFNHRKSD